MIGKQYSSATLGGISYREGVFSCWNDPSVFNLFYHSALMVRRADITPANKKVGVRTPLSLNFPLTAFGSGVEMHRMVTLLDGMDEAACDQVVQAGDTLPWEKPNYVVSDNGQMWRNLSLKFGGIDTDRTKILYGKLGKVAHGGTGIMSMPGTAVSGMRVESKTDFGVVALSSLTDDPIKSSNNMLLSTVGRSRNTDSQFDGEKMVNGGHAPVLSESIHAKITIETERTDLCVWGINAEGLYVGRVPAEFADGKMSFTVGENFPCLHNLIVAD